tara:strand:- start:258 stop:377 length:120 start_codon:yes stop_codon:yes gene_type:complete
MKHAKRIFKGIMIIWLVVMWLILLPFIWLFDWILGGWKK